ncbi:hypothetical protein J2S19_003703 [Metabacillus malikii]|uniref:Uncharacterized protein n=1 Tax=Metabacillus malikii TaxID=1504265 RepID=A0ABT9ZJD0_9BACI|nr:hypothetical protein [Metabacillus malikii]
MSKSIEPIDTKKAVLNRDDWYCFLACYYRGMTRVRKGY